MSKSGYYCVDHAPEVQAGCLERARALRASKPGDGAKLIEVGGFVDAEEEFINYCRKF